MLHWFKKIYIFDSAGLQAFISVLDKDNIEVKFLFDNETSLKGMAISARLLNLLGSVKQKPLFLRKRNIMFYLDNVMLVGILNEDEAGSSIQEEKIKEMFSQLHEFVSNHNTGEVGSFIKDLIFFIKRRGFNGS